MKTTGKELLGDLLEREREEAQPVRLIVTSIMFCSALGAKSATQVVRWNRVSATRVCRFRFVSELLGRNLESGAVVATPWTPSFYLFLFFKKEITTHGFQNFHIYRKKCSIHEKISIIYLLDVSESGITSLSLQNKCALMRGKKKVCPSTPVDLTEPHTPESA